MSQTVSAQTVCVNDVWYNLIPKGGGAEVIANQSSSRYYKGDVVIPEYIEYEGAQYQVIYIAKEAFNFCVDMTSVELPKGLKSIGENAFNFCHALRCMNFPETVTSVGSGVFRNCLNLESVHLPSNLQIISSNAFEGCARLSSLILPENLVDIGDYAFYGCSSLHELSLPSSVTTIGCFAFSKCDQLSAIVIPNSVTKIEYDAFMGCTALTSITLPNSMKSISRGLFYGCSNLATLDIPRSVVLIDNQAFAGCTSLVSITIPNSVITMADGIFDGCSNLKEVSLPNGVTTIGKQFFRGCTSLELFTFPENVTSVEDEAFKDCSSLLSVSFGYKVSVIGNSAFANCSKLTDVYSYAEKVPELSANAFLNSYENYITLHVPKTLIDCYRAHAYWGLFDKIVALDGEQPPHPQTKKCDAPTIAYQNGELKLACNTEGAQFVTMIADADVDIFYTNTIKLGASYTITAYAVADGYENSDVVTATLCWIDAEPTKVGFVDGVANVRANPVIVQSCGNIITVTGLADSSLVSAYALDGTLIGHATANNGSADIHMPGFNQNDIVIVKLGDRSVKVRIK